MASDLLAAWEKNADATDLLLSAVPKAGLEARYDTRTRTVASQFAHIHNVRAYQLDARGAKGTPKLDRFGRGAEPTAAQLKKALRQSRKAVGALLAECEEAGKVRSFKGPPVSYLSYFVAHEAHHRGLVLVSLRLAGIKLDKEITYGLWILWPKA